MSDTLIGYARCCTDTQASLAQALTAQRQRLAELGAPRTASPWTTV